MPSATQNNCPPSTALTIKAKNDLQPPLVMATQASTANGSATGTRMWTAIQPKLPWICVMKVSYMSQINTGIAKLPTICAKAVKVARRL